MKFFGGDVRKGQVCIKHRIICSLLSIVLILPCLYLGHYSLLEPTVIINYFFMVAKD